MCVRGCAATPSPSDRCPEFFVRISRRTVRCPEDRCPWRTPGAIGGADHLRNGDVLLTSRGNLQLRDIELDIPLQEL